MRKFVGTLAIGLAVYLGCGLLSLLPLVGLFLVIAVLPQGDRAGGLFFILTALAMCYLPFMPPLWFGGSGLLAGFLAGEALPGALASGAGFAASSGLAGITLGIYSVQMALSATVQNEPDWWAAWFVVAILLATWLGGILISTGLGVLGGGLRTLFKSQKAGIS